ncbi:hypothetical protein [Shewanella xiamenensis]|nr:hypothetical protein [Shewanella xiamenensis]
MKSIKVMILNILLLGVAMILSMVFDQHQAALWFVFASLIMATLNIGKRT